MMSSEQQAEQVEERRPVEADGLAPMSAFYVDAAMQCMARAEERGIWKVVESYLEGIYSNASALLRRRKC